MPEPPEPSFAAEYVLSAYALIARSRRYEQGVPLPLGLGEIAEFWAFEEPPVPRRAFLAAVLAVDDCALEQAGKGE